ncbi:MAG: polysaccharide deacetylase family protein [Pseudomonadota bacterium]|nr:polysaccharide deacetylase family protein [Pseudomonadota bacterium]
MPASPQTASTDRAFSDRAFTDPAFDSGVFTLSLDFELAWGSRDIARDLPALLRAARVTRQRVFDALLALLDEHSIVATWATVGSLFRAGATRVRGVLHPDVVPPRHAWRAAPWFDGVPEGTEAEHPEFYARSLVLRLRDAGQEIGSHSFSHVIFGDPGCSRETARTELARCVAEAAELGISLRSFVFPRNVQGHGDLLAQHGFTCWRGLEPAWYRHRAVPGVVGRLAHLADVARAAPPPTVMPFRDPHGLWCIPASASFLPIDGSRRLIPVSRRVERCLVGLERAARERRICHLWLHPINLAGTAEGDPERMLGGLRTVLARAAQLRDGGSLEILPMATVAARAAASVS